MKSSRFVGLQKQYQITFIFFVPWVHFVWGKDKYDMSLIEVSQINLDSIQTLDYPKNSNCTLETLDRCLERGEKSLAHCSPVHWKYQFTLSAFSNPSCVMRNSLKQLANFTFSNEVMKHLVRLIFCFHLCIETKSWTLGDFSSTFICRVFNFVELSW